MICNLAFLYTINLYSDRLDYLFRRIGIYEGLTVQHKFKNVEGTFRVVLPNIHAQALSAEDRKYLPIFRLFKKQKEITRSDVEEVLGSGTTHAINMLKEMLDKDLIRKVGNGRLTRYVQK